MAEAPPRTVGKLGCLLVAVALVLSSLATMWMLHHNPPPDVPPPASPRP